jgi:hypothetical protein
LLSLAQKRQKRRLGRGRKCILAKDKLQYSHAEKTIVRSMKGKLKGCIYGVPER